MSTFKIFLKKLVDAYLINLKLSIEKLRLSFANDPDISTNSIAFFDSFAKFKFCNKTYSVYGISLANSNPLHYTSTVKGRRGLQDSFVDPFKSY